MPCWKCGKNLPNNETECEDGCRGENRGEVFMGFHPRDMIPIDFSKVRTLEDVKFILSCLNIRINRRGDIYEKLKRFLEDPSDGA